MILYDKKNSRKRHILTHETFKGGNLSLIHYSNINWFSLCHHKTVRIKAKIRKSSLFFFREYIKVMFFIATVISRILVLYDTPRTLLIVHVRLLENLHFFGYFRRTNRTCTISRKARFKAAISPQRLSIQLLKTEFMRSSTSNQPTTMVFGQKGRYRIFSKKSMDDPYDFYQFSVFGS